MKKSEEKGYIGIDVYPNGNVEILCTNQSLDNAKEFINKLDMELAKFPGIITSVESNKGPNGKVNGDKLIILNSVKEKNRPLQKHILKTLDKFSINYTNTSLSSLKGILESEKKKSPDLNIGENKSKGEKKDKGMTL